MIKKVKKNLVGILSVVMAVVAFQYGVWRAVKNEMNSNTRVAAFAILTELSKLQVLVELSYYDKEGLQHRRIEALEHILFVKDLSLLLPEPVQENATELFQVWKVHRNMLYMQDPSTQAVSNAIRNTKVSTLASLGKIM